MAPRPTAGATRRARATLASGSRTTAAAFSSSTTTMATTPRAPTWGSRMIRRTSSRSVPPVGEAVQVEGAREEHLGHEGEDARQGPRDQETRPPVHPQARGPEEEPGHREVDR